MSRFSSNGSPTCTLGPLGGVGLVVGEAGRGQHADTPPMPSRPGGRAQQHGQVADAAGPGQHQPLGGQQAQAEHVDQRVVRRRSRRRRARRRRWARRRSCRSRDTPLTTPSAIHRLRASVERPEPQRVHEWRSGRAPIDEDVADDAADAGGRALVGLDGRRVVVALDAHGGADAVADVDHAGALARADQHVRGLGGEAARGGSGSTCRSSAPTTSPSTWPARGGWAPAPGPGRCRRTRRRSGRAHGGRCRARADSSCLRSARSDSKSPLLFRGGFATWHSSSSRSRQDELAQLIAEAPRRGRSEQGRQS